MINKQEGVKKNLFEWEENTVESDMKLLLYIKNSFNVKDKEQAGFEIERSIIMSEIMPVLEISKEDGFEMRTEEKCENGVIRTYKYQDVLIHEHLFLLSKAFFDTENYEKGRIIYPMMDYNFITLPEIYTGYQVFNVEKVNGEISQGLHCSADYLLQKIEENARKLILQNNRKINKIVEQEKIQLNVQVN